jgi:enoyl-CoA hydratase/carnithine racemase
MGNPTARFVKSPRDGNLAAGVGTAWGMFTPSFGPARHAMAFPGAGEGRTRTKGLRPADFSSGLLTRRKPVERCAAMGWGLWPRPAVKVDLGRTAVSDSPRKITKSRTSQIVGGFSSRSVLAQGRRLPDPEAGPDKDEPVTANAAILQNAPALRRETDGAVVTLVLNRPASRNSLSEELLTELIDALASIGLDRSVRAVIIAAEGPAFCSGHDLRELTARRADPDGGGSFFNRVWELCSTMMMSVVRLPQPVIACVHGIASAAGCQLVASCDLAVAAAGARFATPGVNIGLFCSTPMVALTRNVAPKHAMEMLLTGDAITAEDARRLGLVNRVVPAGEERAEAMRLAQHIAAKSARVIRVGKRAFHTQQTMGLADAYAHASRVMVENLFDADAVEGIGAFLAKRPPQWQ